MAAALCGPGLRAADPPAWLMQLQEARLETIRSEGWHHIIIDYSQDSSDARRYARQALDALRRPGGTLLGYLSIGEAESYRFYWKPEWRAAPPPWLGRPNKDWPENYKVRFWDPDWRENALKPYLKRLVEQGFDGAYLDVVDAFEYWSDDETYRVGGEKRQPGDPSGEAEAAARMGELLKWLHRTARQDLGRPDFAIVPQNGEGIFKHDPDGSLLASIEGIGVEDLWYDELEKRSTSETNARLKILRRLKAAGKFVVVIDYVDDGTGFQGANKERIVDFRRRCVEEGFGYYAAPRNRKVDRTHPITGIQP